MKLRPWLLLLPVCLAPCSLPQAKELGRLFFTPEQRRLLENGQLHGDSAGGSASVLTVNGIVQKQGGKRTVWINGVPQAAGNSNERSPAAAPVLVPGERRPVELKVGQKLQLDQPSQPAPERTNK